MTSKSLAPLVLVLVPLGLWWGSSAFRSQREAPPEYRIEVDIKQKQVDALVAEGWEFAGYLGQSVTGSSSDETLWKRSSKH